MQVRSMLLVVIGALIVLTACGGGSGAAAPSTSSTSASTAPVSLTLSDAPPAGVALVSFEVTVNSATLQPGNVPLIANPLHIEVTKLETDTAFLNTAGVAPGNYSGITVTFSSPELTIVNNSGTAIGSCAVGGVCELNPPLNNATVTFTGAPFPLTISGNNPLGLALDLDLQNSIQASLTINPVLTVAQLPAAQATAAMDEIDEVVGQVTAKDATNNQFTIQVGGSQGQSLTIKVDANTRFDDFEEEGMTSGFAAMAVGQVLQVHAKLLPGGSILASEIELAEKDQSGELEGEITSVGTNQFQMVVVDEEPNIAGVQVGNPITVNIQSGASFQINDQGMTLPSGATFAGPADLMVGQHVQIRPTASPSGTPLTVTTDRVRLRNSHLTARVAVISGASITLDTLPAVFTTASPAITQIVALTSDKTEFEHVAGISGLAVGNTVSVRGLLFDTLGTPTLAASKIRKR